MRWACPTLEAVLPDLRTNLALAVLHDLLDPAYVIKARRTALLRFVAKHASGNHPHSGPFAEAFHWSYLGIGFALAVGLFGVLRLFGLPILLVYGLIRGLDQAAPHVIIPQFLGGLLGRYYFARRFGEMWKQYIIVFYAGYAAGTGLVMMLSLGVVFVSKSVFQSAY